MSESIKKKPFGQTLLENTTSGTVGGLISGGMGLILQGINDRRQLRQQEKLNRQQLAIDKEMTDYAHAKQLEMWEKTNYPAQMEMLKKAGLNPALLYGTSGGGGMTVGSGAASSRAATAPSGGNEMATAMGLQLQAGS